MIQENNSRLQVQDQYALIYNTHIQEDDERGYLILLKDKERKL